MNRMVARGDAQAIFELIRNSESKKQKYFEYVNSAITALNTM
jgi:hypothetical protein